MNSNTHRNTIVAVLAVFISLAAVVAPSVQLEAAEDSTYFTWTLNYDYSQMNVRDGQPLTYGEGMDDMVPITNTRTSVGTVTNIGSETMPLGTGFHSTFRFPLGDRSPEAYRTSSVRVTTADFYWKFDWKERFAITGEKAGWNGYDDFRHGKIINRQPISRQCPVVDALIDGKPFRGAILDFPVSRMKVLYRWDEKFGQTALWNREDFDSQRGVPYVK